MGIYTLKVEGEKLSDGPYAVSEENRIFMKGLTGGLIRHGIKVAGCRIFFEKKKIHDFANWVFFQQFKNWSFRKFKLE